MRSGVLISAAVAVVAAGAIVPGMVTAEQRTARYVMQPTEGGVIRMDTETGAVALCARRQDVWSCEPMGDSGRQELEKLRSENADLKATVKHLEEMLGVGAERPQKPTDGPGLSLPTEKDVDRAIDYVERMYKKFRDRLKQLEGQTPGSTTPL